VRVFATLVRRHLARLSADRTTLIAVALAAAAALFGALATAFSVNVAPGGSVGLGARVRAGAWDDGTALFNVLVFVLCIQLGASHVSTELRRGTLFSWLARPLARGTWTLASWTAAALLVLGLEAARSGIIYATCWWIDGSPPSGMLLGAVVLAAGSLLVLSMVFAIAAAAPAPYAVAVGLAAYLLGNLAWQGVLRGVGKAGVMELGAMLLPLFARHAETVRHALIGTEVNAPQLVWVLTYRLGWTVFLLSLAVLAFSHRDLSPRG